MRTMSKLLVAPVLAAAVTTGAATAASASVAPQAAHKHFTFTKKHEGHKYTGKAGTFHAQIAVKHPKKGYPMAWSFKVAPALQAIATGRMTCTATGLNGHYHDKHVVPVSYLWHSSVKGHRTKKVYNLSLTCHFPVQVAGKPGKATIGHSFYYAIDPSSRNRVAAPEGASAMTTTVRISR
ncbi:hypothetical protein GCM10029978_094580 [Actinoallomurus acanthiterrae]